METPAGCRVFDAFTAALCATDLKVKALTLMSIGDCYPRPPMGIIQAFTPTKATLYHDAFGHLETLNIHLPPGASGFFSFGGLSGFIFFLLRLAKLGFSGTLSDPTGFEPTFLNNLHISQLRSVEISDVAFSCSLSLLEFFSRHSRSLQRVKLHDVVLEDGFWETVFSEMRDTLRLHSSDMGGSFHNGCPEMISTSNVEICNDMKHHGLRVLPDRAIEDFIEGCTDADPFDLVRESSRRYPRHVSEGEFQQCSAGICPHRYKPAEAEIKLMEERKVMAKSGPSFSLSRYNTGLLPLVFDRQGRTEEARILRKVAKGEEKTERFRCCGGLLKLRDGLGLPADE